MFHVWGLLLQDIRIAMDTDYESVLTTSCLSALPSALLALTRLTSLSLASQGEYTLCVHPYTVRLSCPLCALPLLPSLMPTELSQQHSLLSSA